MVKFRPDFASTNDTPYLALTGELCGVFREIFKGEINTIYRERRCVINIKRLATKRYVQHVEDT